MGSEWREYMRRPTRSPAALGVHRVTWWLIGANAALWFAFAGAVAWGGLRGFGGFVYQNLLLHPRAFLESQAFWQPFTAMWFHDWLGVGHVFWNVLFLFLFGRAVEETLGRRGYLALYLLGGLAYALALVGVYLFSGRPAHLVGYGASGGVFAVAAFLALRTPKAPVHLFFVRMPLWVLVGVFMVGHELLGVLVSNRPAATMIGSLAGAVWGLVHQQFLAPAPGFHPPIPLRNPARERASRSRPPSDERVVKARVDELLAKIHEGGIGSLTRDEKDFLQQASERFR